MKAAACVFLLAAMLALSVPAYPAAIPVTRHGLVLVIEPDDRALPRRRRRNHYRGW